MLKNTKMKKLKVVSFIMFTLLIFACQKSMAQTQENQDQQPATQTGDIQNPDATQAPAADGSTVDGTQATSVTIDSTGTTTTGERPAEGTSTGTRESTTKIHIYSGKQDGNNVINPDPKN